jgi:hypothetical protein
MEQNEPWYAHLPSDIYGIITEALRRDNALVRDHAIQLYIDRLKAYKTLVEGANAPDPSDNPSDPSDPTDPSEK